MRNTTDIQNWLIAHIAKLLDIPPHNVDIRESFSSHGLSSLDAVTLSGDLEEFLGQRLSPTLAYDYPNILSLSNYLVEGAENLNLNPTPTAATINSSEPIAIIGMACRFPQAKDPESFWQLLLNGIDAIGEIPKDRWNKEDFYHPDPAMPGKSISYWGGFLDGIDQFDPFFFGISPAEAKQMDPQQRLLLELSHEALDDAGKVIEDLNGSKTGVFVGISINEYSVLQFTNPTQISSHSGTGNALSIAANRISYFYNFHGPSIAIDTACSSSLAAVHLACQSLRNGECTHALAGGVNVILSPAHSISFTKAGVLAPDGRCKSFDARANGYVRGEGGGLVLLKPLSTALADGDPVHAVILGSAMMQDGRTNGLIAPSGEAQEVLLREAYRSAGVSPGSVQYVEAHGTGTVLGDAMEAKAIGNVIGVDRANGPCTIGSVKTNIGHLESAAGIAGLIKVILSIKHRTIPGTIHYHTPNPHIPFEKLNLRVDAGSKPWPSPGPSLAGINSFGFGGTNVHLILREAEQVEKSEGPHLSIDADCKLLPLSANSGEGLKILAGNFLELLASDPSLTANDICYAASFRRSGFNHRLAIIARSKSELSGSLHSFVNEESDPNLFVVGEIPDATGKLAFVFSGQGGQWYGMGRELLQREPVFYNCIESIDHIIGSRFGWSLIDVLRNKGSESRLEEIDVVQPATFAIQVALATLWRSWGIIPDAVVGHSMGEIAAAYVAGVLTLEDAIQVVCSRSELLKQLRGKGSMLVTELSWIEAEELLMQFETDVSIAAMNGPTSTVLSGNPGTISKVIDTLQRKNLFCKLVNVDVASHSPQVDELRSRLVDGLRELNPKSPQIHIYSTVTGASGDDIIFNADYWFDNIRKPVLFSNAIQQLFENGYSTFVEIGPHPVLVSSIQQIQPQRVNALVLPSLRRDEPEREILLRTLGMLYVRGFSIDWKKLSSVKGSYVHLPSILWQRQRYWMDMSHEVATSSSSHPGKIHPLPGERINLAHSPGFFVWQAELKDSLLTYFKDHRIGDEILFPASAYIDMVLQCAKEAALNNSYTICDLALKERMVLHPGQSRTIQSVLSAEESSFIFRVYCRTNEEEDWTLHATATLKQCLNNLDIKKPGANHIDVMRGQSTSQYTSGQFYKILQSYGLQYGPGYKAIEHIWSSDDEALGHISLPESIQFDSDLHQIHPVVLDACFQVLAATKNVLSQQALYLPNGCKQVRFFSTPGREVWSHVSLSSPTRQGAETLNADIKIYDNDGNIIAELIGFQLQRIGRQIRDSISQPDAWLYKSHWKTKRATTSSPILIPAARHWLIFADDEGLGKELAAQLEAGGDQCFLLFYRRSPNDPRDSDDFLGELIKKQLELVSTSLYGIIHLWSLSILGSSPHHKINYDAAQVYGCSSVLTLIKALAKRIVGLPRLWLVTRGAQAVKSNESVAIAQSPLWGLGKVISFEIPELKCIRIDLDPLEPDTDSAALLLKEFSANDGEDQIAFRKNLRFVHRLSAFTLKKSMDPSPIRFRSDSSYLITGGLGGLGLEVAEWMSKRGAQHIVLLGRSDPSSWATNIVEKMRGRGVDVVIVKGDVSDPDQLQRVFDKMKTGLPPLRGVVHGAGILDDGSLFNLDSERMKKVMKSKLDGTWNLHLATLDFSLDFFVLFSSAVSVLGSPGQGNYAAACAYLDAFAWFRHSLGLPAISINWGPWADVGLAAEATEKLREQNGSTQHLIKAIKIDQGLEMLGQLLTEATAQVMVLPFDLKNLIELYPMAASLPFLEEVGGKETHIARLYARPKLRQQYVAPRNEIEHKLAQLWQQTLHIDKVGVHDSFFELGGDSVLAAQVLSLAQKSFGISINPQDAFKAFTIEKLSKMLEQEILSKIEEMSDDEVQRLLSKGS